MAKTSDTLFPLPPADGNLTPRQQSALDALRREPSGMRSDELGAAIHAGAGKHGLDERCRWCQTDALLVANVLRRRGLVVRRRATGLWQATSGVADANEYDPSSAEIPF